MNYQYLAASPNAFVQQLAVGYVSHGYRFYVTGIVPNNKNAVLVDHKLIEKYNIAMSKWSRARRKERGLANVHYLRHYQFFVLIATKGAHYFFDQEGPVVRDIRYEPIKYAGYSISYKRGVDRKWHASVRINPVQYKHVKSYFMDIAARRSVEQISKELGRLPFEPYAPVRRQMLNVHRAINRKRKKAGLVPVPITVLRLRRKIVRPFEEDKEPPISVRYQLASGK